MPFVLSATQMFCMQEDVLLLPQTNPISFLVELCTQVVINNYKLEKLFDLI